MAFKLFESRKDRIKFVTSLDDAVDTASPEGLKAYQEYLESGEYAHLILLGEPVVFSLRPLDIEAYEFACRDARGIALKDIYVDSPTCRELLRLSVEDITPWPEGWPEKETCFRFEYRRKVLSPTFITTLPPATCREAAKMLLDSLPLPPVLSDEGEDEPPFPKTSEEK